MSAYDRFRIDVQGRRGLRAWLTLLSSQPRLVVTVAVSGVIAAASTVLISVLFAGLTTALNSTGPVVTLAALLIVVVVAAAVFGWIKERAELRLVLGTRFLAFRSLFDESLTRQADSAVAGRFVTQPAQISQFSYVIDLVLCLLQATGVAVFVIIQYSGVGWIALVGILLATAAGVRLVHLIGEVYGRYIASEGDRVGRVRELADSAVALRLSRLNRFARIWLQSARRSQHGMLHQRARYQIANGMVTTSAVPLTVTAAALVFVVVQGDPTSLLPLLLALGLLSRALQEALTNYRVVRLAVPMLRDWDARRASPRGSLVDVLWERPLVSGTTAIHAAEEVDPHQLETAIAEFAEVRGWSWVPAEPSVPAEVLAAWASLLDDETTVTFSGLLRDLELPGDLSATTLASREGLSFGETHRLALALVLANSADTVALPARNLASLDRDTRERVVRRLNDRGIRLVLVGDDIGVADHHVVAQSHAGRLVITPGGGASTIRSQSARDDDADELRAGPQEEPAAGEDSFPTPRPTVKSAARVAREVFGLPGLVLGCVLVVALAVSAALLPVLLDALASASTSVVATALGILLVAMITVSFLLYYLQFTAPIRRLTDLHARISDRFAVIASPRRTGELAGRFGEDFSAMQMEIPAQLFGAVSIVTQTVVLVAAIGLGQPVLLLSLVAIVPLSFFLYRTGETRIVAAISAQATSRGRFLAMAGSALSSLPTRSDASLRRASQSAYASVERNFVDASSVVVVAMMRRRTELQLAGTVLFVVGLLAVILLPATSVIAPAVLAYFVYSIALLLPSLIESFQRLSVATTTALRVDSLLDIPAPSADTEPVRPAIVKELEELVGRSTGDLIRLSGRSGAGKSLALRALFDRYPEGEVVLLQDDLPLRVITVKEFAGVVGIPLPAEIDGESGLGSLTRRQRQLLLVDYGLASGVRVLILDETLSALASAEQAALVRRVVEALGERAGVAILVSHTADDLASSRTITVSR